MNVKPIIGLTSYYFDIDLEKNAGLRDFFSVNIFVSYLNYVKRIEAAGGIPLNIPCWRIDDDTARSIAGRLDGILFIGGEDINPMLYNELRRGANDPVSDRDEAEMRLFDAFYRARKPILGICRGAQLMNVFFKGKLIQDIHMDGERTGKNYIEHLRTDFRNDPVHTVTIADGSRMATVLMGRKSFRVNSLHHQAIGEIGEGLVPVAWSEDGIIEALERPGYPFMFGVQWHPERLSGTQNDALFETFVSAAAQTNNRR
ncbi:MAG: gamma-glutamyl-gamma-aminobutyrate hydrolase family protein [Synergistaceae bacterium]|nr:gamma-glutamyl-gamma-aminobutyrate hydrolase family protein [Synergistaceae bacterium]